MKSQEQRFTKTKTETTTHTPPREESGSFRMQPAPIYRGLFRAAAVLGLALAAGVCFIGHEPIIALLVLVLFGGISVPMLISYHTRWISFDDVGFTWNSFWGIRHRYSYEEVTGLANTGLCVELEVCGKKHIRLDETWVSRQDLVDAICKNRSTVPPKMNPSVVGMSLPDIARSYEDGILKDALLVSEENECRSSLFQYKCIHYAICACSVVLTAFAVMTYTAVTKGESGSAQFFGAVLVNNLLMFAALVLYFRYPEYFTAREKPMSKKPSVRLDKERLKYHKLSTMAPVSGLNFFSNAFFLLVSVRNTTSGNHTPFSPEIAIVAAALLFGLLIAAFHKWSWEYRTYKVGYVSYFIWQLIYCTGFSLLLYALLMG